MGIDITTNTNRDSQLNRRISADLRQRAQTTSPVDPDDNEEVDDTYVEGTKKTSKFTIGWIILIVLAIISLLCIVLI